MLAKDCGRRRGQAPEARQPPLFTRELYDSPYDNENSFGATYGEHREALELDRGAFVELQACARELGLVFFATAFDEPSADLLEELDVPAYKIASGDLRNTPLLRHVASFGKPMIVSTGGATLEDVDRAVEAVTADQPGRSACCSARPPIRRRSRSSTWRDHDAAASATPSSWSGSPTTRTASRCRSSRTCSARA